MYSFTIGRRPTTDEERRRGDLLADLLRSARHADGRSAESLARAVDASVETIRAIEGKKVANPGFMTVAAIGRELRVSLDDLAERLF